jgi:hypothetical protein
VIAQYLQGISRDRDLAIHCKKEGVNLEDLVPTLRIKNYIRELGTDEERVEQFITRCAASQDPKMLVDVLEKIGNVGLDLSLGELEQ